MAEPPDRAAIHRYADQGVAGADDRRAAGDRVIANAIDAEAAIRAAADEVLRRMDRDGLLIPKPMLWAAAIFIVSGAFYMGIQAHTLSAMSTALTALQADSKASAAEIAELNGARKNLESKVDYWLKTQPQDGKR